MEFEPMSNFPVWEENNRFQFEKLRSVVETLLLLPLDICLFVLLLPMLFIDFIRSVLALVGYAILVRYHAGQRPTSLQSLSTALRCAQLGAASVKHLNVIPRNGS